MTPEDAEEYTQALEQVQSGGWRQVLLGMRMGVPEALGLSTREWAKRIGGHVQLSIPERQEAVLELTVEEGLTQREAADVVGVHESTVSRDLSLAAASDKHQDEPETAAPALAAASGPPEPPEEPLNGTAAPTLGEMLPQDFELPPGELSAKQKGVFAVFRLHVLTKYPVPEMIEAVFEAEAACGDADFSARNLEKLEYLVEWLSGIREGLAERLSKPRLIALSINPET